MGSIMLLAIIGNLLVVVAFCFFKHLRTVNNCFILALAVSDLLVAFIPLPMWMLYTLSDSTFWAPEHARTIVFVWLFFDITCSLSSIFLLVCISVERYMSVAHAMFYMRNASKKIAVLVIGVVWVLVITLTCLRFAYGNGSSSVLIFDLFFSFGCFLVPLLVMILMYVLLLLFARRHVKDTSSSNTDGRTVRFLKETRIAKTMAVVVFAFFVCWFPFFLLHFLVLCDECTEVTRTPPIINATKWLHYGNSVLNPMIYAGMSKEFRNCFKIILGHICRCLTSKKMQQSSTLSNSVTLSKSTVTETDF